MKTALITLWIILFGFTLATGQAEPASLRPDMRYIKLYRATVKTMTGEKTRGIFYAMTDSTLVFFADNQAAIRQFRAGDLPELDTMRANDVKRITIRRKDQFIIAAGVGLGVSALLIAPILIVSANNGDFNDRLLAIIPAVASPLGIGVGLILGSVPRQSERINGKRARFQRFYNKLDQYTIVSQ